MRKCTKIYFQNKLFLEKGLNIRMQYYCTKITEVKPTCLCLNEWKSIQKLTKNIFYNVTTNVPNPNPLLEEVKNLPTDNSFLNVWQGFLVLFYTFFQTNVSWYFYPYILIILKSTIDKCFAQNLVAKLILVWHSQTWMGLDTTKQLVWERQNYR